LFRCDHWHGNERQIQTTHGTDDPAGPFYYVPAFFNNLSSREVELYSEFSLQENPVSELRAYVELRNLQPIQSPRRNDWRRRIG